MIRLLTYNLALSAVAPVARLWLKRHATYQPLTGRFSPEIPQEARGGLCIHVCSVGEANAARPLVEAMKTAFPDAALLVTASTVTGYTRCCELYGDNHVSWFPFDVPGSVRGFLSDARPRLLVLFETELWPNVLAGCRRRNIPVLLANGRLSDKHLHRYQRYRWWFAPMIGNISVACMQETVYRDRLVALGAPEKHVHVTGNIKFDAVRTSIPPRERQRLRAVWGLKEDDPVLLFACTRPGDEALASACWATLREENPRLRLFIAPRHLERVEEVLTNFSETVVRRTELNRGSSHTGARVFVIDTLGELGLFYGISSIAVIGGSFYSGVNGHNPLEAAALGVPVVFGPLMSNFNDAAQVLTDAGGATQVGCPEDLYLALSTLLADPARLRQMGTAARRAVLRNQGATQETIGHLRALLERTDWPPETSTTR